MFFGGFLVKVSRRNFERDSCEGVSWYPEVLLWLVNLPLPMVNKPLVRSYFRGGWLTSHNFMW